MKGRGPIADEVERRMKEKGLSRQELSERAGLGKTYVSELLRDKNKKRNARTDKLEAIAAVLGCTVDDLTHPGRPTRMATAAPIDGEEAEHLAAYRAVPKHFRPVATEMLRLIGAAAAGTDRVRSKKAAER